eukprot:TRINITY_DN28085_c0_g1_i1.p2 TRINITY_DN28085_c0_g1~~TRINITY_DN28085_c0_g1_i1.p2  ORF type:complete len:162 (-),score=13.45 TRINITY_DN28085_c0_g1_i1:139-624(-)
MCIRDRWETTRCEEPAWRKHGATDCTNRRGGTAHVLAVLYLLEGTVTDGLLVRGGQGETGDHVCSGRAADAEFWDILWGERSLEYQRQGGQFIATEPAIAESKTQNGNPRNGASWSGSPVRCRSRGEVCGKLKLSCVELGFKSTVFCKKKKKKKKKKKNMV